MTREAAVEIAKMIDRHWSMYLFAEGEQGAEVWITFLTGRDDIERVMAAVALLAERQKERPTVADLRGMLVKLESDERMARPALPEAEFVREIPLWAKGWALARSRGDTRVWPQQKDGYDTIQREHPDTRTHVWPEQTPMPDDDRKTYEEAAAKMGAAHFDALLLAVVGGRR